MGDFFGLVAINQEKVHASAYHARSPHDGGHGQRMR